MSHWKGTLWLVAISLPVCSRFWSLNCCFVETARSLKPSHSATVWWTGCEAGRVRLEENGSFQFSWLTGINFSAFAALQKLLVCIEDGIVSVVKVVFEKNWKYQGLNFLQTNFLTASCFKLKSARFKFIFTTVANSNEIFFFRNK